MDWSNADEVDAFILSHKDRKWEEGERFILPDIDQEYEVVAVRAFKRHNSFRLFVDLEAQCAVEGCDEFLMTSKEVHQWRTSYYLPRCCTEHRGAFNTPMKNAWLTYEQREKRAVKDAAKAAKRAAKRSKGPRVGRIEQAVLQAVANAWLVADRVSVEHVTEHAIGLLRPTAGKRDTRRQMVVRAVQALAEKGRITVRGGDVLL